MEEKVTISTEEYKKLKSAYLKLKELEKIQEDIESIPKMDEEGELSDWAKNELDQARKRKDKLSHEEVKKIIFSK